MEFDNKAKVVAECWMITRKSDDWKQLIEFGDIGFPLAWAHTNEAATLGDRGKEFVIQVYDLIVATLMIDASKVYEDFEAMLDENIRNQGLDPDAEEDD